MKQFFFFVLAFFLIQVKSFSQDNTELIKKVITKSDDIINGIMKSHLTTKSNNSERTVTISANRVDGYLLINKMGQYWDGTNWINSSYLHFTYNPQGKLIDEIDQYWEAGGWLNSHRYKTSYYNNDLVSLYEEFIWDGVSWINSYQYISTYNGNDKLTEYNVKQWSGSNWINMYKTTYSYTPSGNLQIVIDQTWNGSGWDNNFRNTYQYNGNNDISEKIEEQWMDGNWINSIRDVYYYNPQNLVSLIASYWWPGAAWKESVEIYYQYDGLGNITDRLTKFWESEELGLQNKYHATIEYVPGTDLQSKIENQEWDLSNQVWFYTSRDIYTYNGNNILILYVGEGWNNGSWEQYFRDIYSLDSDGNLDTLLSQYRNGTEWTNSFRSMYTWSLELPVELTSFKINQDGCSVNLAWTTATEKNNLGFEIERKIANNNFVTIGFVAGNGTTLQPNNYTFSDINLSPASYVYRLKQVDFNGSFEYSNELEIVMTVAAEYSLDQNYPNPFNPGTNIKFNIPSPGFITLRVYDVLGEEISTLISGYREAGTYNSNFDGSALKSGIYFYELKAGNFISTKKMILLK